MSGYIECACCGEVIVGEVGELCDCCKQADCDPEGSDGCNVPQCPHCEVRATFMNDRQWHANCDDDCPNAKAAWS